MVKRAEECKLPLVISGSAGSGKTSVALESLKKIKGKFEGGKILYITKSENLIKESKKLLEYEDYDDEFKIPAPGEIDFLSLHEFLEKQAEDIKGKKPIDRSKFFSWFNEICKKDKFKEYKKDGDKIFEEFTAVIGGGGLLGEDGKDRYAKLGSRQSMYSVDERNRVYSFFKEYREFIEKDSEYYDPNLVAYECITEGMYSAIVVDEVQDLTESTLSLILKSLKDESRDNFLLCGDINQVIHPSFFSLSKLKSFLCQNQCIRDQGSEVFYTLEKNYRNSEQVIEIANRILHLKNYCFASEDKITVDNAFLIKSETKKKGNVGFIADDKKEEIAKKINESVNCAVLVLDDESKEDARKLFDTPLVFNIHEAKGLEFENVILYKFTSCKAYNEIWNIVCSGKSEWEIDNTINSIRDSYNEREVNTSRNKDKKDKSLEKYKFYMNALYVGVTRAVDSVYIIDDESNLLKIIEPREEGNVNIEQEKSSPEEWRNKALELIEKGNIEQAELIARKLQNEGKKEYAEEIMNALRANGYHEKVQNSDKNKHTNSVLESDISSRSSQSSEHEGKDDDISNLQNEKGKHNQSKKKKAKKRHQVQEVKPQLSLEDSTNRKHNSKKPQNERYKQDLNDAKESKRLEKNTNELFLALANGNLKMAKRLIEKGVNVHARNKNFTPLHIAAQIGCYEIVESLLSNGAEINVAMIGGYSPLHLAAENGHYDVVKLLLLDNETDVATINGRSPLHSAAQNGHYNVVELLLEHGAIVGNDDKEGCTPLHLAAESGHYDVVKLLLDNKADVNVAATEGYFPLHSATQNGHYNVVELLLDNKADVNVAIIDGSSPLYLAAEGGHYNVVELLLKYKADVKTTNNNNGCTALHVAAEHGNDNIVQHNIVQLLLDNGADIDARNSYTNLTSLHYAVDKGCEGVVKLLLQRGADASARSSMGCTPLYSAAQNGYKRVAKLLLEYKAKADDANENGHNALHIAATFNRFDIAQLLLKHEADVNTKASDGTTPLVL
ncbi:ankyrin repeat domain-containing protein [Wolbachia endosymbiont of Bemisia tabaci]|uniref:ankyrin repeat domain-containing protein n=1 Tax=Wolbachia endosymbiont of Bemisia tabaci TaxID=215173 RepID=UPI0021064BB5|nr:ankyrin repeat domain-containing protein [Wolbachia endosymbiont of Bemisia tabaci]